MSKNIRSEHFLIYKTTNLINGKIYIGKHKTKNLDDGYMGSGKLLQRAISKYGIENFTREILFMCSSEEEMNAKEAELVTEEFCNLDTNYNLCVGGQGGFSYVNREIVTVSERIKRGRNSAISKTQRGEEYRKGINKTLSRVRKSLYDNGFTEPEKIKQLRRGLEEYCSVYGVSNPSLIPEIRNKINEKFKTNGHAKGVRNSQYGTIWITNGTINRKIKNNDTIPIGWIKGRKLKSNN